MAERIVAAGGFSVLDGAALVAGAAVAAVHVRGLIGVDGLGLGSVMLWGTYIWVALTAGGPFLYLVRRYLRRLQGYPQVGDRLWAMLGLPWILTVLFQSGRTPGESHGTEMVSLGLGFGLPIVSMIALGVVWSSWVMVSPQQASRTFAPPWTNRMGLLLAVAWPVQCGVGMVVIG
jgi:hypothetical protein